MCHLGLDNKFSQGDPRKSVDGIFRSSKSNMAAIFIITCSKIWPIMMCDLWLMGIFWAYKLIYDVNFIISPRLDLQIQYGTPVAILKIAFSTFWSPVPCDLYCAGWFGARKWDTRDANVACYPISYPESSYDVSTLYVLFFQMKQKHKFEFYVISPYWHETGSWISTLRKIRRCLFYMVNIMGADVLATQGARVSATMISTMLNRINSVPAL